MLCLLVGVKKLKTSANYTQRNGQIERHNRTLAARMRYYVSKQQKDWDTYIQMLTHAYSTVTHRATGTSTFSVMFPRQPTSADTFHRLNSPANDMRGDVTPRHMPHRLLQPIELKK